MKRVLRFVSILIGVMAFATAIRFAFAPAGAVERLGMPLLDGAAASTQIGDVGALFLAVAVFVALSQRAGHAGLLIAPAILMGSAAVMRTLAFLTGHAPFLPQFIVPEAVMAGLFFAAARSRRDQVGGDAGLTPQENANRRLDPHEANPPAMESTHP